MKAGLLSDLAIIGYEIYLEGDNIRYRYRKPGDPPDMVKPLIDELRKCKAEVINILKTGNTITPSTIVAPGAPVGAIWVNPYEQGIPEARHASLMAVMEAVWTSQFQGIINKVLNGRAKLADFRQAVEAWERICLEEIKGLKH